MSDQIIYRKSLLDAVEAFLQGTSSSIVRGQKVIEQCLSGLRADEQEFTLNGLIWRSVAHPLIDSVYFTSQEYLLEIRQLLQGLPSKAQKKLFIAQDFRSYLTEDEAEWYAYLLNTRGFIQSVPFAQIATATMDARQHNIAGSRILEDVPEAMSIMDVQEDYQRRKTSIETLAACILPHVFR